MIINSLTDKQIKKLFKILVFTTFKDNKIPPSTAVVQGPSAEIRITSIITYDKLKEELEKKVEEVKGLLKKNGVNEYISTPSYMMTSNQDEIFVIGILVVQSRIVTVTHLPPPQPPGPQVSGGNPIQLK